MVVYRNNFDRLKGIQLYREVGCGLDVWNVSNDILTLIDEFFDLRPSHWWVVLPSHFLNYRVVSNTFYFNDEFLFSGARSAEFTGVIMLGDYNLLAFSIDGEGSDVLIVTNRKSNRIIGYLSSYGSKASSELSQLIISTPEVDWRI